MPQVKFEPRIQVFERAKAVHALDCAATVIDFMSELGAHNSETKKRDK
jgi:hypothetical protein